MLKIRKILCTYWFLLICVPTSTYAQQVGINSLRYWSSPDHTRMVFDTTSSVKYQISWLKNPTRLVIDFSNTKLLKSLHQPPKNHQLLTSMRSATRNKNDLRVVIHTQKIVKLQNYLLKPGGSYGHRLVFKLFFKLKPTRSSFIKTAKNQIIDTIIALDAGHGGEDPGALGARGVQEKKVVLQIAKKVAVLINKKKGMQAVLIRTGDYYVDLRKRMKIARAAKADIFISIHADAVKNSKAKGASVYILSNRGASSEAARGLAQRENATDFIGGVKLANREDYVAETLIDLTQTKTKEFSHNAADIILHNFKKIGHLHKHTVQKANFMVLKSPDIASILIETAFISNPEEEKNLNLNFYQKKIASAISKGIVSYFKQHPHPPANTIFAMKNHVISSGDTLYGIASKYGVSVKAIKLANALSNSKLHIGQILKIPKRKATQNSG